MATVVERRIIESMGIHADAVSLLGQASAHTKVLMNFHLDAEANSQIQQAMRQIDQAIFLLGVNVARATELAARYGE